MCLVWCTSMDRWTMYPSYQNLKNTLSTSSNTNTRHFIGFMIFWSLSNIAIWFPIEKDSSFIYSNSVRVRSWISAITSSISSFASMVVNTSDYTRFACRPSVIYWPQLPSSKVIYGQEIWNPLDLLNTFLNNRPSLFDTYLCIFYIDFVLFSTIRVLILVLIVFLQDVI